MKNATQETRPVSEIHVDLCTVFPDWCEDTRPDHQEHSGSPDVPPVSATGEPGMLVARDGGVLAPRVTVTIMANHVDYPGQLPVVNLAIDRPDAPYDAGQWAEVSMTIYEADLLRRHLVQALRMLGREVTG